MSRPTRKHKNRQYIDRKRHKDGRLTVTRKSPRSDAKGTIYWCCRCKCGAKITVAACNLQGGNVKSCGCLRKDVASALGLEKHALKHGNSAYGATTPEYN